MFIEQKWKMNIKILDLRSTKADKGLSKASEVGDGECWVVFFFIVIFFIYGL